MKDEKILQDELMSDEELDNVAGGTRQEFNENCNLLGKSPKFNTRDGIRNILNKNYGIEVRAWNTGDRGSTKDAPAEFYLNDNQISFDEVKDIINRTWQNLTDE